MESGGRVPWCPPPTRAARESTAAVPNGNLHSGCGTGESGGGGAEPATGAPGPTFRTSGTTVWLAVACLSFPVLAFVSGAYRSPLAFFNGAELRGRDSRADGGLLADGFGEDDSCLSRRELPLYRGPSGRHHRPSSHLSERLRRYEALHRRCAPHTAGYNRTLRLLTTTTTTKPSRRLSPPPPPPPDRCSYLLWTPENGLGNRMISLASSFLYALLTGRVLLIDRSRDMADLFCEPFPGTTWLLPPDFPVAGPFYAYNRKNPLCYGNLLRTNHIGGGVTTTDDDDDRRAPPPFVFLYLTNDYDGYDKRFFCESDQRRLRRVPWLMLRSDQYFAPGLFAYPAFGPELARLFPEKEAALHLLSRYLFHPADAVWGMVTRYHRAYLAAAAEVVGIQVRTFGGKNSTPDEVVLRQILNCTLTEKLLPEIDLRRRAVPGGGAPRPATAVLLTSLESVYYERLKDMYLAHPAAGGAAVVGVHQPSHEGAQRTGVAAHDAKALAEMYLLSLSDVLVTSGWSTFGYVSQGLGGLRPWILLKAGRRVPEPACVRAMSMEPCFHFPPNYDCGAGNFTDMRRTAAFLRSCEDLPWGLKMVGGGER